MPSDEMRKRAREWLYSADHPNECASEAEVDDLATLLDEVRGGGLPGPSGADPGAVVKSRSIQRREAAQRGEDAPQWGRVVPGCAVDPLSSRTCCRGTRCCTVEHDRRPTLTPDTLTLYPVPTADPEITCCVCGLSGCDVEFELRPRGGRAVAGAHRRCLPAGEPGPKFGDMRQHPGMGGLAATVDTVPGGVNVVTVVSRWPDGPTCLCSEATKADPRHPRDCALQRRDTVVDERKDDT